MGKSTDQTFDIDVEEISDHILEVDPICGAENLLGLLNVLPVFFAMFQKYPKLGRLVIKVIQEMDEMSKQENSDV